MSNIIPWSEQFDKDDECVFCGSRKETHYRWGKMRFFYCLLTIGKLNRVRKLEALQRRVHEEAKEAVDREERIAKLEREIAILHARTGPPPVEPNPGPKRRPFP
jgi:hypothetical protein